MVKKILFVFVSLTILFFYFRIADSAFAKPPPDPCAGYKLETQPCGDSDNGSICCPDDQLICNHESPRPDLASVCRACQAQIDQKCQLYSSDDTLCCANNAPCVQQSSGNYKCQESGPQPSITISNPCPNGYCQTAIGQIPLDITAFIKKLFQVILSLSGGVALILIIYGGYRLSLSQGNPEKVQQAKEIITSAIVGLLFIILSVTILQVIGVNVLGLTNIFQ